MKISTTSLLVSCLSVFGCTGPETATGDQGHAESSHGDEHAGEHGSAEHATSQPTSRKTAALPKLDASKFDHFGGGAHKGEVMAAADLVAAATDYEGKTVRVTGPVGAVCRSAGCWLTVGTGASEIFVDTKHEFTVPTDCKDRDAVVERAFAMVTKNGKTEATIVATGVALAKTN